MVTRLRTPWKLLIEQSKGKDSGVYVQEIGGSRSLDGQHVAAAADKVTF